MIKTPIPQLALATILSLTIGAMAVSPATAARASSGRHEALKLLGKSGGYPAPKVLSVKKQALAPDRSRASGPESNHEGQGLSGTNANKRAGIFFDLNREVQVEAETWQGSTGLQINW